MAGQKPTVSNDNHDENIGQRGEVTKSGGNKVHGDDLEGAIPDSSLAGNRFPDAPKAGNRVQRADGDNDDKGELDDSNKRPKR